LIRAFSIILAPLAVLIGLICLANLLCYAVLLLWGDLQPIHKLISRTVQVLLALCVFPLRNLASLQWAELGFAPAAVFFRQIASGLLLSIISLLPVFGILYLLGVHVFDETQQWTAAKLGGKIGLALLLSLLIGLFEEILFRGLLLTLLRRYLPTVLAVAISAVYYAEMHFLRSTSVIPYSEVQISSGFNLMAEAFGNLLNPNILSAVTALFVVGVFLGMLRTRQAHNIGLCIGCHCGWVWQIKLSKDLFNVNPHSEYLYLVSDYDGVVGPMVSVWLVLAMLVYWSLNQHREKSL
jgi:uncharacterized protein